MRSSVDHTYPLLSLLLGLTCLAATLQGADAQPAVTPPLHLSKLPDQIPFFPSD